MPNATPGERSLRAQVAAHVRWANVADRSAATAPARLALFERYLRQVDPDGVLPEGERIRRAISARKADLARMALERSQTRRGRQVAALFDDGQGAA